MANTTALRNVQGQWQKTFPVQINTETVSLVFVKKLFAVAVSNVAYVRKLFPENAFFAKNLEGISMKILKEEASYPGSCKVVFWLRGCFDAIEKRYLRKAILALYEDPQNPSNITESFSFGFRYDGSRASMDMQTDCLKIMESPTDISQLPKDEQIKAKTKNLLNTILMAGKMLGPLPKKMMLTMKLQYYDAAPCDYLPSGFKTDESLNLSFSNGPVNVKIGAIETGFHSIRMLVHTSSYLFDKTQNNFRSPLEVTSSNADKNKHAITVKSTNISHTPRSTCQPTQPDLEITEDGDFEVNCPCGVNSDDGVMILCDGCERWQHAVCFRIIDDIDLPKSHLCHICANSKSCMLETGSKTDSSLLGLTEEQLKSVCLLRRGLHLCLDNDVLSVGIISKRLSVETGVAKGILNKLNSEGAVKDVRGKGGNKVVLKAHVEGVLLPRFFDLPNEQASPQQMQEDGSLSINSRKNSHIPVTEEKHAAGKRGRASEIGDLTNATVSMKLEKEFEFPSQESVESPGHQKRRRIYNCANTPIPVVSR